MAQLGQAFDPASVPDDLVPEKTFFLAQVIASELKATKSGTGQMIVLTWELVGGPFAKKQIFQNINYRNDNATAERIGQRELSEICKAVGIGALQDTNQLHMRPCKVRFKTERSDGFAPKSIPAAYERWDGAPVADAVTPAAQPRGPTTTVTQAPQQAPPAAATPPLPANAESPWG